LSRAPVNLVVVSDSSNALAGTITPTSSGRSTAVQEVVSRRPFVDA
jgi:hypothetical protein